MNRLVSIVVPVYNAERNLGKCIESLINQTYKNIEIIVVDDEPLIAEGEAQMIRQCAPQAEVVAFTDPAAALDALRAFSADVAFLDF